MKGRRLRIGTIVKALGLAALLLFVYAFPPLRQLAAALEPQRVVGWLEGAGPLAPLALIGLMTAAVVISPIPSLPLDLAAGAYFGPFLGGLYALAGALLGAMISFGIARLLGRRLVERFLSGHVNFCAECSDKVLTKVVFLSRLLPIVSFDVVSYGAGLTRMSASRFALATGAGMIPATFAYTYFGSAVTVGPRVALAAGAGMVLLFFLLPRWLEKYDPWGMSRFFRHGGPEGA